MALGLNSDEMGSAQAGLKRRKPINHQRLLGYQNIEIKPKTRVGRPVSNPKDHSTESRCMSHSPRLKKIQIEVIFFEKLESLEVERSIFR